MLNFLKRRTEHPKQNRSKLAYDGAHDSYGPQKMSVSDSLQALEPRIMFDAAGVATGAEVAADEVAQDQAEQALTPENLQAQAVTQDNEYTDELVAALADVVPPADRNEIIFIDSNVENYNELLSGINSSAELVFLDRDQDGMEQIADVMSQRSDVDSIHIIAHSDSGQLQLGNTLLTQDSMQGAHADELSTIKSSLNETAEIRIYGGEFSQGEEGQAAMNTLSDSTDSDVFDSEDFDGFVDVDTADQRREIIFVDISVKNYQELISGVNNPNSRVILIDGAQDGMQQIVQAVQQQGEIDAIHLISHGDAGQLNLGASKLDAGSMQGTYADELATIKSHLSETADILIYGCNFGEGDEGAAAASLFAELTGADIAASTDETGHSSHGADWDLELQHGDIETGVAINASTQDSWKGKLEVYTLDFDTSPETGRVSGTTGSVTYSVPDASGNPITISYSNAISDPVLNSGYTGGLTPAQEALFFEKNGGTDLVITIDFSGQPGGSVDNVGFSLFDVDNNESIIFTGVDGTGSIPPTNVATSEVNNITATTATTTTVTGDGTGTGTTSPDGNVYAYYNTTGITSITFTYATPAYAHVILSDITFVEGEVLEVDLDSSDLDQTVDDDFDTVDYTGDSSGLIPWNGDWFENDNTAGGASNAGDVQVVDVGGGDGEIRLTNTGGLHDTSITRALDLSGYIGSEITFDYNTSGTLTAADTVSFEISTNGGVNWTTLETFTGNVSGNATVDISGYENADNQIRFRVAGGSSYTDAGDYFYVDNIEIVSSPSDFVNPNPYIEGDITGVAIANVDISNAIGAIITDNDSTDMSGATITIQNFVSGDDLSFTNTGSITGSYDSLTGILTLSGTATIEQYQAAIESVLFTHSGDDPTVGGTETNRTIAVNVQDDSSPAHVSNDAIATINIIAINDAPVVAAPGADLAAVQNVTRSLDGTGFSLTDVDESGLGATMTLSVGTGAITVTPGTGITISGGVNGTNTVVVSGTVADLNNLLTGASGAIDYLSTVNTNDSFTVTVNDLGNTGSGGALESTNTVALILNANAPTLDLDSADGTTRNSTATFTEGAGAVNIISTTSQIVDMNSATLQSATITLSNPQTGDVLAAASALGITATVNGAGDTVTLTGTASLADYQTVIESITFDNSTNYPNSVARTITIVVEDDTGLTSNTATTSVGINLVVPRQHHVDQLA
jgi:hypothetical protein